MIQLDLATLSLSSLRYFNLRLGSSLVADLKINSEFLLDSLFLSVHPQLRSSLWWKMVFTVLLKGYKWKIPNE